MEGVRGAHEKSKVHAPLARGPNIKNQNNFKTTQFSRLFQRPPPEHFLKDEVIREVVDRSINPDALGGDPAAARDCHEADAT